jgi:chloride channel 3/4/5
MTKLKDGDDNLDHGMSRIMPGTAQQELFPSASSSSHSPQATHTPPSDGDRDHDHDHDHDRDELDLLDHDAISHADLGDRTVLDDDPIRSELSTPVSFKRRQKSGASSGPSRLLSAFLRPSSSTSSLRDQAPSSSSSSRPAPLHPQTAFGAGGLGLGIGIGGSGSSSSSSAAAAAAANGASSKDGAQLDWYPEGPGRRVGYENLTAIDWIFEYTKERQRLRLLSSGGNGLVASVNHLLDASQVWVILLLTGLTVGAIAAAIDVTTNWLGDLKLGYCSSGPEGGHFYLNRDFCCYGYDQGSHCAGWKTWGEALGIGAAAGRWSIGYIFFTAFSVSL